MKHINHFSESTLAYLEKDHEHAFYVYCLIDPRNDECFYVGKGKGIEYLNINKMRRDNYCTKIYSEKKIKIT